MLRVRSGDRTAFAQLVERYQRVVLNSVYRYVGNRATAEDLTQDVFVRMFRAASTYERRAKFETWLHRIVFNLCANAADYGRRRRALSLDLESPDSGRAIEVESDDTRTPLDRVESDEVSKVVRAAIEKLPAQQKAALILSRYRSLAHQEIADALDVSVEAVKSLLFRARENLREALAPYLKDEVRDDEL